MSRSRRSFLRLGGMGLFLSAGGGLFASARADTVFQEANSGDEHVLVVVFLRGGLDGMHALVPYDEPEYYAARPTLAVPRGSLIELDGRFGLNPALRPLESHFRDGALACVCAVGTDDTSRSHFLAQDHLEYGGNDREQGWLNRYLGAGGEGLSTLPQLAGLCQGPNSVYNLAALRELRAARLAHAVEDGPEDLARVRRREQRFRKRLAALRGLERVGEGYPKTHLGEQLAMVAFLLKQGVELQGVHCELSGFDTHSRQIDGMWPGRLLGLNLLLSELAEAVDVFWRDLGPWQERVTLLTVTEFGRRLEENASLGTDHGLASTSFVLGAGVAGGQVHGHWPGLDREQLVEGIDLAVTTDYRAMLNQFCRSKGKERLFPGVGEPDFTVFRRT